MHAALIVFVDAKTECKFANSSVHSLSLSSSVSQPVCRGTLN